MVKGWRRRGSGGKEDYFFVHRHVTLIKYAHYFTTCNTPYTARYLSSVFIMKGMQ